MINDKNDSQLTKRKTVKENFYGEINVTIEIDKCLSHEESRGLLAKKNTSFNL